MDGYSVGFVVGVALFVGIGAVGKRYGSRVEKRLERALWIMCGGAFAGLLLLGLIWSAFFGSSREAAREQSIARTVRAARPAIDDYRAAADRYLESDCAEGARSSGEPTEAELLCPAGIFLDARWFAAVDAFVTASGEAPPACSRRLMAVIQQVNVVDSQVRRSAIKTAAASRPGDVSAASDAVDRAFARLDAVYAAARAACRRS